MIYSFLNSKRDQENEQKSIEAKRGSNLGH